MSLAHCPLCSQGLVARYITRGGWGSKSPSSQRLNVCLSCEVVVVVRKPPKKRLHVKIKDALAESSKRIAEIRARIDNAKPF